MKRLFIVSSWKSNKTIQETEEWLHKFSEELKVKRITVENKKIIICPSFTSLEHARYCSRNLNLPVQLGAQDISPYEEGAYTGEVNGKQIKEFADYVIIGHSERRQNFFESEDIVKKKFEISIKYGLIPILCISDLGQIRNSPFAIRTSQFLVAYEPLFAIGTGLPDTPGNANKIAGDIKKILGDIPVLYGGSVTSKNVRSFTETSDISGVLVGGASLDPIEFLSIVNNA